jgi:Flp pilus assembly protein TadD
LKAFEPFPFGEAVFWKKKRKEIPQVIERKMIESSLVEYPSADKMNLIKEMINRGLYEEALGWIRSMKTQPSDPRLWKDEIVALEYLGRREEALEILEEALRLFPEDKDLLRLKKVMV